MVPVEVVVWRVVADEAEDAVEDVGEEEADGEAHARADAEIDEVDDENGESVLYSFACENKCAVCHLLTALSMLPPTPTDEVLRVHIRTTVSPCISSGWLLTDRDQEKTHQSYVCVVSCCAVRCWCVCVCSVGDRQTDRQTNRLGRKFRSYD
jgi:hypothetical protein